MAYREFRDDSGTRWTVWDTYPQSAHRSTMASLQDGWLTFEGGSERRRLVPAPRGWFEESEDRLRDWLEVAEEVKSRLEEYEARTATGALAATGRSRESDELPRAPAVTEDVRSLIERSRQTLDDLNRAIEGQFGRVGDPPELPER